MTENWLDRKKGVRFGAFYLYGLEEIPFILPNRTPKMHQIAYPMSYRANFQSQWLIEI